MTSRVVVPGFGNRWQPRPCAFRFPSHACHFFLLIVACPAIAAAAGWADSRTVGPLVVRADFSLAGATDALENLGHLQEDLVHALGIPAAKEPVEVHLFHDQAAYARYLDRYLPGVPYRKALYVKGKGPGRVFAYWSREFEVDLRHESTHALLHASLPAVPLWLDEGLAKYFEVPAARRALDNPYLATVRENVRSGSTSSIEGLEKKSDLSEMGSAEYRDSWAWTHFLLHGPPEAREALTAFLADIQRGAPPGALSDRLRRRLPDLPGRFAEHFLK
jgi:hypothetical protein